MASPSQSPPLSPSGQNASVAAANSVPPSPTSHTDQCIVPTLLSHGFAASPSSLGLSTTTSSKWLASPNWDVVGVDLPAKAKAHLILQSQSSQECVDARAGVESSASLQLAIPDALSTPSVSTSTSKNEKQSSSSTKKLKPKSPSVSQIDFDNNIMTSLCPLVFHQNVWLKMDNIITNDCDIIKADKKYQSQLHFNFAEQRRKILHTESLGLHSGMEMNLDADDEAFNVTTWNWRELSWYIIEDIVMCQSNEPFLLCIHQECDDLFSNKLSKIATIQSQLGIAGELVRIKQQPYYCLRIIIGVANFHNEIIMGQISMSGFETLFYNYLGDFQAIFVRSSEHSFSWRTLVDEPQHYMFFGCPLPYTHQFNWLFKGKVSLPYLHHIFHHWFDSNYLRSS